MNFNPQQLMQQAKKLQDQMLKLNEKIADTSFEYEGNGVRVSMKGNYSLEEIKITNLELLEDKETLEDMLTIALRNVIEQILKEKDDKLGQFSGGVGGLF